MELLIHHRPIGVTRSTYDLGFAFAQNLGDNFERVREWLERLYREAKHDSLRRRREARRLRYRPSRGARRHRRRAKQMIS